MNSTRSTYLTKSPRKILYTCNNLNTHRNDPG
jgi:hypothetical protein